MKWADIAILVLIAGYCAYILFAKKRRGCSGCCENCRNCSCNEKP